MKFIAHRGLWESPEEKNTVSAFEAALKNGFGIETDVRDYLGELVISHDIATQGALTLSEFLCLVSNTFPRATLAINVKSDGLQQAFRESSINGFEHFYFDMSVPDALLYSKSSMRFYTRYSDIEPFPSLLSKSVGVWVDNFSSNVFDSEAVLKFLEEGKRVVLVSPELHGYSYQQYWNDVKSFIFTNNEYSDQVELCTDYPIQAQEFFYE